MRRRSLACLLLVLTLALAACRPADGGAGESNGASPSAPADASPSGTAAPDGGYGY